MLWPQSGTAPLRLMLRSWCCQSDRDGTASTEFRASGPRLCRPFSSAASCGGPSLASVAVRCRRPARSRGREAAVPFR
eukprot:1087869-Pyramimonas_sp.AAC.1